MSPLPHYGAVPSDGEGGKDSGHHTRNVSFDDMVFQPVMRTMSEAAETFTDTASAMTETANLLSHPSFALKEAVIQEEDRLHEATGAGIASIPSEVANISKNLIGGGVLSLSGGMALYANDPRAWVSSFIWIMILGAVFGYFCLLIGKSCEMSLSPTYRECWERTVGHRGGLLVAIVNTLDPLLGIFANASILSQSLQLLLEAADIYLSVVNCLLLVTFLALLPLCLMKNLGALAPFSAFGMVAVMVALGCMIVRYLDGSYQPGGEYYDDIPRSMQPSFGNESHPWSIDALPFVCMVFTSFDMHYNGPAFYRELKDASVPRFAQVCTYSFGITSVIYFAIATIGFITFGANSDSYILNNYSSRDSLATMSRIAIGFCALISYPLNFIGVRDNCLDILGLHDDVNTAAKVNAFTIFLLSLMTLVSCFVTDLGLINSVGGGTTVTLVCFIFPAFMFREGIKKHRLTSQQGQEKWEVWFVMTLMVVGVVVGLVGVWSSVTMGRDE